MGYSPTFCLKLCPMGSNNEQAEGWKTSGCQVVYWSLLLFSFLYTCKTEGVGAWVSLRHCGRYGAYPAWVHFLCWKRWDLQSSVSQMIPSHFEGKSLRSQILPEQSDLQTKSSTNTEGTNSRERQRVRGQESCTWIPQASKRRNRVIAPSQRRKR